LSEAHVSAADRRRDHFGDSFDFRVGHLQGATDVFDRCSRSKSAEGDDLANGVAAIQIGDVIDNVPAASDAKIDVDVWQRDPSGVKESLEDEVIL
jgi:hypothetical protein